MKLFQSGNYDSQFFRIPFATETPSGAVVSGCDLNFGTTGDSADHIGFAVKRMTPKGVWTSARVEGGAMADFGAGLGYCQEAASFIDGVVVADPVRNRLILHIDLWPWNGGLLERMNVDASGAAHGGVVRSVATGDGSVVIEGARYLLLTDRPVMEVDPETGCQLNRTEQPYNCKYAAALEVRDEAGWHPVVRIAWMDEAADARCCVVGETTYALDDSLVLYDAGVPLMVRQRMAYGSDSGASVPMKVVYQAADLHVLNTGYIAQFISDDDGRSWRMDQLVSLGVKPAEATYFLTAPGRGVCLSSGRLLMPVYWGTKTRGMHHVASVIISDDGGETWFKGGDVPTELSLSEGVPVALPDGRVLLLLRSSGETGGRILMSESFDGGATWSVARAAFQDEAMSGLNCQLSAMAVCDAEGQAYVLVSTPWDGARKDGRIWVCRWSADEVGESVLIPMRYQAITDSDTRFGYSCLFRVNQNTVGVIYEQGPSDQSWAVGLQTMHVAQSQVKDLIETSSK